MISQLITALMLLNVHGSKAKCDKLVLSLVRVAAIDSTYRPGDADRPIHFDEDLETIKLFKQSCEKGRK
jgi:hypothetical protein